MPRRTGFDPVPRAVGWQSTDNQCPSAHGRSYSRATTEQGAFVVQRVGGNQEVTMSEAVAASMQMADPVIGDRERELVEQVLSSGVLALGPFARRFGDQVAAVAGRRYGVACSSGTAGLHMVIRALEIGEGDEVITTPFSFVASVNCILYERATPVFVDIDEDTLGLDPDLVEGAATERTVGVLPVHVFGRPSRIEEVEAIARRRDWRLVEDACEALGSTRGGRPMGSYGDASVFAFYPNKQITTGEGGVVVTDDERLAATFRSLSNQGRDDDGTWMNHIRLGYNYRMDELSAAIGVAQLERLPELREGRARAARAYHEALGEREWVRLPAAGPEESVDWFVYVVRLDPAIDRDAVMADLARAGVPSRPYFSPLHLQPAMTSTTGYAAGDFPVTERVAASTLALPWGPRLTEDAVGRVAEALITAVERRR
jgi:perosamine synthetase